MNHNLLQGELRVKKSIPSWNQYSPMITISNQACFTKVCVRGLQEGRGKKPGYRFHLLLFTSN